MHLLNVLIDVSLLSPGRLIWAETFRFLKILHTSENSFTSYLVGCLLNSNFMDPKLDYVWLALERYRVAINPLLPLPSSIHFLYFKISFLLLYYQLFPYRINPFPNKPWFLPVCSTSLLKTLREKEKLLVTSNFSFYHSFF